MPKHSQNNVGWTVWPTTSTKHFHSHNVTDENKLIPTITLKKYYRLYSHRDSFKINRKSNRQMLSWIVTEEE